VKLTVNGKAESFDASTIADVVRHFDLEGRRIAVEHNRMIIKRTEYETTSVKDADVIEILHFVGGG